MSNYFWYVGVCGSQLKLRPYFRLTSKEALIDHKYDGSLLFVFLATCFGCCFISLLNNVTTTRQTMCPSRSQTYSPPLNQNQKCLRVGPKHFVRGKFGLHICMRRQSFVSSKETHARMHRHYLYSVGLTIDRTPPPTRAEISLSNTNNKHIK